MHINKIVTMTLGIGIIGMALTLLFTVTVTLGIITYIDSTFVQS